MLNAYCSFVYVVIHLWYCALFVFFFHLPGPTGLEMEISRVALISCIYAYMLNNTICPNLKTVQSLNKIWKKAMIWTCACATHLPGRPRCGCWLRTCHISDACWWEPTECAGFSLSSLPWWVTGACSLKTQHTGEQEADQNAFGRLYITHAAQSVCHHAQLNWSCCFFCLVTDMTPQIICERASQRVPYL